MTQEPLIAAATAAMARGQHTSAVSQSHRQIMEGHFLMLLEALKGGSSCAVSSASQPCQPTEKPTDKPCLVQVPNLLLPPLAASHKHNYDISSQGQELSVVPCFH